MDRTCLACGQRPADTLREYPALCLDCLDRTGDGVTPGTRVVCDIDESCSGTVARIEDGLAVVTTRGGGEAWVPIAELIVVTG